MSSVLGKAPLTFNANPNLPVVTVSATAGGVTTIISFPDKFFGIATSVILANEDSSQPARFRTTESNPFTNLPASEFRTIDLAIVKRLEIITDALSTEPVIVSAQVVPFAGIRVAQQAIGQLNVIEET